MLIFRSCIYFLLGAQKCDAMKFLGFNLYFCISQLLSALLSSKFSRYDDLCENLKFYLINDYNVTANQAYNISLELLKV